MPPSYANYNDNLRSDRMRNAYYWAAQIRGWLENGPNAGLAGRYYVTVLAGRPVIVLDESWNAETVLAIRDGLREDGFPPSIEYRELDSEWRMFVDPTGERLVSRYYEDWRGFVPESDFSDTA